MRDEAWPIGRAELRSREALANHQRRRRPRGEKPRGEREREAGRRRPVRRRGGDDLMQRVVREAPAKRPVEGVREPEAPFGALANAGRDGPGLDCGDAAAQTRRLRPAARRHSVRNPTRSIFVLVLILSAERVKFGPAQQRRRQDRRTCRRSQLRRIPPVARIARATYYLESRLLFLSKCVGFLLSKMELSPRLIFTTPFCDLTPALHSAQLDMPAPNGSDFKRDAEAIFVNCGAASKRRPSPSPYLCEVDCRPKGVAKPDLFAQRSRQPCAETSIVTSGPSCIHEAGRPGCPHEPLRRYPRDLSRRHNRAGSYGGERCEWESKPGGLSPIAPDHRRWR